LALEVPQAADFRLRVTRPTGSQALVRCLCRRI